MSEVDEVTNELKKPFWKAFFEAIQSPYNFITHLSTKSPLLTALAVVFLLQPIVSTGVSIVEEWRTVVNPLERPIKREEFDLLTKRVDFLQQLIVQDMQNDLAEHAKGTRNQEIKKLRIEQQQLDALSKKLDNQYRKK